MATLALPGRAVPALAVTAAATTINLLRRTLSKSKRNVSKRTQTSDHSPTEVNLQWRNLTCTLDTPKSGTPKNLLTNISGTAKPGRVLAILGPSGAGKTTLLNSLAGRLPASSSVSLYGEITYNGVSVDHVAYPVAYVTQQDLFFSQLTVQETLDMAARMRLPRSMSNQQKKAFVDDLIRKLGLSSAKDTRVGDQKNRGISGGERKRLSLGCELISTPRLILCDEPTSGLDAFQAEKVMKSLRDLAEAGHTVVCSIHQPSSNIFQLCDDIALLASGKLVFSGPADEAPAHFADLGYKIPEQCNPAEWYLDLISVDFASDDTVTESHARIEKLVSGFHRANGLKPVVVSKDMNDISLAEHERTLGPFGRIRLLLRRAWLQITRDKKTFMSRFMSSFMSALLFGAIYWRIGKTQSTIQDRLGLLQVCTINTAMTALVKTLNVFPREGVLANRERARGSYNVVQYFISKLIAEMPVSAFFPLVFSLTVYPMVQLSGGLSRILRFIGIITLESFTAASYGLAIGALLSSTEAALAVGPASFVLQIVFGGLYITDENVPKWASWIPRISLIKHAYEGLCVNEFRDMTFETRRPWDVKTGEQVLQRMTWTDSTVLKTCISQGRVLAFNYLVTYAILTLKKPKFEKLQPPPLVQSPDESETEKNILLSELEQSTPTEVSSPLITSAAVET